MKRVVFFTIVGLVVALAVSVKSCYERQQEAARLRGNVVALMEGAAYYRTKDSLSAASVQQLTLTAAEFRKYNAGLVAEAEALRLKIRRLEMAGRTAAETEYRVVTEWRDSIVVADGRVDTVRCMSYSDVWLDFDGCEVDGAVGVAIISRDTLVQFVHRVPRRFLGIPFGTKAIRQEVVSKNPYTEIVYTEFISLKRR